MANNDFSKDIIYILIAKEVTKMQKEYKKPDLIVINLNEDVELFRGRCNSSGSDSASCYA